MRVVNFIHKHLGRAYDNCDCWDLTKLFYSEVLDKNLSFVENYGGPEDSNTYRKKVSNIVEIHKCKFIKVDAPEIGDIILFNIMGIPSHVGIFIGCGKFIHSIKETGCVVESLNPNWIRKLEGYYRWPE